MEFDLPTTAALFIALIAVGVGGLIAAPMMGTGTILTMVLPSMVIFGLLCLFIGMKYGQHRSAGA